MKHFKLLLLVGVMLILNTSLVMSQYLEAGASLGLSAYTGEFAKQINLNESHAAYGIFARYNFTKNLAVKGSLNKITISGEDQDTYTSIEDARNLNFRTDIIELGAQAEYYIGGFAIREGKTSAPYLFAGLNMMYFNPKAQYQGNWVELQPLGTEGQGYVEGMKKYNRVQLNVPMGVGVKFSISPAVNLGVEVGYRVTFTDYLDDVSGKYPLLEMLDPATSKMSYRVDEITNETMPDPTGTMRGDPSNNDHYVVFGLNFSINLGTKYDLEYEEEYKLY